MTVQPTRDDKFTFGLWTVGWQARDPFGDATRGPRPGRDGAPARRARRVRRHVPRRRPHPVRRRRRGTRRDVKRFRAALDETGLVVPMVTTNLFTHPVFKDGGFTANDREVRRFALRKVMRNIDLAAELGASTYVFWGGREGSEVDVAKDVRARSTATARRSTCSRSTPRKGLRHAVRHRAQAQRAPRRHPAADGRPRAGLHRRARARRHGRRQPRGRARADGQPQLHARHRAGAVARQALPHRPERSARPEVRPGPRVRSRRPARRFGLVDLLETAARGRRAYNGPRHFDYKPLRTEDMDGVWQSAAANMRTYLLLENEPKAFRADPEVQGASGAAGAPTSPADLAAGESYQDLLSDRRASRPSMPTTKGEREPRRHPALRVRPRTPHGRGRARFASVQLAWPASR